MYLVVLREVIDLTCVSIKDNECSFSDVAVTGGVDMYGLSNTLILVFFLQ